MSIIDEKIKNTCSDLLKNSLFDDVFDKIVKTCILNFIEDSPNTKILDNMKNQLEKKEDIQFINICYNTLMLLITEFQKKNYTESEILMTLNEIGFQANHKENFVKRYNQFKEFIESDDTEEIKQKFNSSIEISKIVDIEYTSVYSVSSKFLKKINRDIFLLKLKVLNDKNEIESVSFKCSLEQLNELVFKLKSACKSIEIASDLAHIEKN